MQTVSPEMAQRLKDAGWDKETYWVYVRTWTGPKEFVWSKEPRADRTFPEPFWKDNWLPAPTLDEIRDDFKRLLVPIPIEEYVPLVRDMKEAMWKGEDPAAEVWRKTRGR